MAPRASRPARPARPGSRPVAGPIAGVAGDDARWMVRCLELAARGGRTSPNPRVGCVIVSARGEVLAEGWHRGPGTAHAEVDALARLGGAARGATLYVNLEPCDHHGRTPPCAPAVIASGVRRVVIGAMDPVPGHGGGARRIARAGIEVTRGVLAPACEDLDRGFFTWARHGRPWFTLKAAMTLDGRIATARGESRWITGAAARAAAHGLRASHDAVLVGVGTVLADDPALTVRDAAGTDPARVVVDSRLRTPPTARLLTAGGARVIVAGLTTAPAARRRRLERAGATVLGLPAVDGRVDLGALARALAGEGVTSVLVEGGGEVHASLLGAGLADEVVLHVAPRILGGRRGGPAWVGGDEVPRLADAHRLALHAVAFAGDDLILTLRAPRISDIAHTRARSRRRGPGRPAPPR
ncbi:MAG: bifunctional diaminohydroxyphosphoribosylaminopyrimidine deaminase/5-amino-6-(5-phosphoribosylamino)uracil reductase RibD [Myxococcales bacterium]|nr:bifunctional diaminohydroxyphosphoribosylaminopyrimidine deaminase/5-amino-6-(5-phosphoribosylamino)uracil reductase RibD [Myxococcales bacterium]